MKKIVTFLAVVAVVMACASCKKDTIKPAVIPPDTTPSISDVVVEGDIHNAGEWVAVKWKSHNMPANYYIFASIFNQQTVAFGMRPAQHVLLSAWATADTGEAVFQIIPDDGYGYNLLYYRGGHYGEGFKISIEAVLIHPDGNYGGSDKQFEAVSNSFTVIREGCSSIQGYSTKTGAPCFVPLHRTRN